MAERIVNRFEADGFYRRTAARIIEAREGLGLSKNGLAKAANLSISTIVSAEEGAVCSLYTYKKIATALGMLRDPLLSDEATS